MNRFSFFPIEKSIISAKKSNCTLKYDVNEDDHLHTKEAERQYATQNKYKNILFLLPIEIFCSACVLGQQDGILRSKQQKRAR